MNRKRLLIMAVALMMFASIVAGCAGKNNEAGNATGTNAGGAAGNKEKWKSKYG